MFAMDDNWDLQAVVRSCTQPDANGTTASWFDIDPFTFPSSPLPLLQEDDFADLCCTYFPDLLATPTVELEELFKPFYSDKITTTTDHADHPSPPLLSPQQDQQKQKPQEQEQKQRTVSRSKRRKNQQKRVVCQVPTEDLSSDMWAWRKYGQKPIKGSPYPRSYYRCSSSKGCPARKQVERSQADPAMFIITYSSEHNHPLPTHRNSLAGSTRQKYPESAAAPTRVAAASEPPKVCSPLSLSPRTPLIPPLGEHGHDHELHIQPHKEELLEDFDLEGEDGEMFMDLEELSEGGAALSSPSSSAFEDCFVTAAAATATATATEVNGQHHFPPFSCSPWLVNNTATAARGR